MIRVTESEYSWLKVIAFEDDDYMARFFTATFDKNGIDGVVEPKHRGGIFADVDVHSRYGSKRFIIELKMIFGMTHEDLLKYGEECKKVANIVEYAENYFRESLSASSPQ